MLKKLRYGIFLGLAILIIDALIPLIIAQRVAEKSDEASAADAVYDQLQLLLSAYQDAETGQRGFMLTGQDPFLAPYIEGHKALTTLMPQIGQAVADDREQAARWRRLQELTVQESEFQEMRIGVRRRNEPIDVAVASRGLQLMDGIRAEIGAMSATEQQRVTQLLREVKRLETLSRWSIIVITALDLLLFAFIYWIALRAMNAQEIARAAQLQLNEELEHEARLRTEALEQIEWQAGRLNEIVLMQGTLAQSQLNAQDFLDQIVRKILKIVPGTGAVVEMIDGPEMVYKAASGAAASFIGLRLRRSDSLSGQCVADNHLLVANDTHDDPRVDRAACQKIGVRSMIVAPLLREGGAVGVLKVISDKAGAFGSNDEQTLQLMTGYIGTALGQQMQFEKTQSLLTERGITLSKLERELERREEYERQILGQRQRTETILESSHEAFICIDQQGIVQEWNAAATSTFGWKKDEVLGRSLTDLIIPDRFRDAHNRGIAHYLHTGEGPVLNRRIELPALCRDGREIPIELTISAVQIGERVEFSCFLRDITERKRAEAALLNQQATLRALTDAIPALVSLVDANEQYAYCNQQYEVVFGVATEQIIGKSLHEFLGDELYARCKPHVDKSLAGEIVVYERTLQSKTGLHYQECRHVPQFDAKGKPNGFYLIAWDITERKTQEIEWQSRASTDQLTGLPNRAFFLDTLNLAVARQQRTDSTLAVFYLDVDRFKHINDTYGHAAGDAVLKAFAEYLQISVRQSDVVGRLGGDEFCILLDNIRTPDNAIVVAEKILALARIPVTFGEHSLSISTSVGIAFAQTLNISAEQLIAVADSALYKAKQAGRDRYALDMVTEQTLATVDHT
jgi:diguanylate cyclase (GGDEF)-like protein/PAS domain S-box-containing protein